MKIKLDLTKDEVDEFRDMLVDLIHNRENQKNAFILGKILGQLLDIDSKEMGDLK